MAMQETARSLRAYLIVAAILQGVASVTMLFQPDASLFALLVGAIGGALALAYLYLGVRLRDLITQAPARIIGVLYCGAAHQVVLFLLSTHLSGFQGDDVAMRAIALLIIWYLIGNVRRLAAPPEMLPTRET